MYLSVFFTKSSLDGDSFYIHLLINNSRPLGKVWQLSKSLCNQGLYNQGCLYPISDQETKHTIPYFSSNWQNPCHTEIKTAHTFDLWTYCVTAHIREYSIHGLALFVNHTHIGVLSCQHWFTGLPVVLKFMLSRFLFNQSTGRAEKIHERFLFDRVIFMDR